MGRGFFEMQAGAAMDAGAYLRAEAGYRPAAPLGLFGFGQLNLTDQSWTAGVGARVVF